MATADSRRATVFLTVLSASIIALALAVDATGFGPHTTTLAMVLLPLQRHTLDPLRDTTPRFPTPPQTP